MAIKRNNYISIGWSLRSLDTLIKSKKELINRLLKKNKPGDIILFHDNLKLTAESLEDYIISAKKNGIIFVSTKEINSFYND